MKAAILAAGKGIRLSPHFGDTPKALIEINGKNLLEWLLINLKNVGFTDILIIARDTLVKEFCEKLNFNIPIKVIVCNTKSAFYSFLELKTFLEYNYFGLFTVDTFANYPDFLKFKNAILKYSKCDFLLGITEFIQDETPVGVLLDNNLNVVEIGKHIKSSRFIASGMYYCSPNVWKISYSAIKDNILHFSDFMNYIILKKLIVKQVILGKVLDIDTIENIDEAIKLIKEQ